MVTLGPSPPEQNETPVKKYLPATSLAGGNNQLTRLSLSILPSASSLALACLRFRILWYCLAFTYSGSSSNISAPGNGIRCICTEPLELGTIYNIILIGSVQFSSTPSGWKLHSLHDILESDSTDIVKAVIPISQIWITI